MNKITLFTIAALMASPALAHPGHAEADRLGFLHWLTLPDHLALLITIGAALVGAVLWRARSGRGE